MSHRPTQLLVCSAAAVSGERIRSPSVLSQDKLVPAVSQITLKAQLGKMCYKLVEETLKILLCSVLAIFISSNV